jgi:hypothetical protein
MSARIVDVCVRALVRAMGCVPRSAVAAVGASKSGTTVTALLAAELLKHLKEKTRLLRHHSGAQISAGNDGRVGYAHARPTGRMAERRTYWQLHDPSEEGFKHSPVPFNFTQMATAIFTKRLGFKHSPVSFNFTQMATAIFTKRLDSLKGMCAMNACRILMGARERARVQRIRLQPIRLGEHSTPPRVSLWP